MHMHTVRKTLGLLALAAFCMTAADISARAPLSRQLNCEIETIDRDARTLKLLCEKESKPLELVWHDDTWFVHNQHFTNSAALKPSSTVRVYYQSPFFEKKFVTRVVWVNGSGPQSQPKTDKIIKP